MSITMNGTANTEAKVMYVQQSKGNITKDFRAHTRPALRAKKARLSKKVRSNPAKVIGYTTFGHTDR